MLEADIKLRLSRLNLDTAFTVASGEVLALLGPNGSGKSTTLRALMGLLALSGGRVVLDGTVLEDPAQRIKLPPEQRPIGLMFQDYLLFPHLSAVENVAFGLRAKGTAKKAAREKASEAMARALVTDPKLLLLDEPLAALDVSTKTDVRRLLRQALGRSSAANVLVTHDLLDAVALGDRMIVIQDGAIVQTGTPAEVTARPRSRYVADLVGVNLLHGTARGTVLDIDGGGRIVTAGAANGPVLAIVAPAGVALSRQRPDGQEPNTWRGRVSAVDLMGDRVRVRIDGTPEITGEVPPQAVDELKLDDGGELWASVSPSAVMVYAP